MGYEGTYFLLLSSFLLLTISTSSAMSDEPRGYNIHMDKSTMPSPFSTTHDWYVSTLSSVTMRRDGVPPRHIYTYNHVMDGFSVVLTPSQLKKIENMPGHLASFPEARGQFHTTHTPKFLGLQENVGLWPHSGFGDDMIIGMMDSGIWPESESFNDEGMPPIPARWKGACEKGVQFDSSNCNNKLIGARSFSKATKAAGLNISTVYDYDSARDFFGHGTHTSSTTAGSSVSCASHFGYAKGKATGMAPKARLAMYKVGFYGNDSLAAFMSDTLAGMDQAIADGVDLMSLSIGFPEKPFYENAIALGAFAAIEKGIFVTCSAGNSGHGELANEAPWITTVAAGTIDRDFGGEITLGENELRVMGISAFPDNLLVSRVPFYYGNGNRSKETCQYGSLDPKNVTGKYVFCDSSNQTYYNEQVTEFQRSGALGAIIVSKEWQFIYPDKFSAPFLVLKPIDAAPVKDYLLKSKNPIVSVKFQVTVVGTKPAPQVAYFSSRGPGSRAPWVLKPDIMAPGYNVLAGWAPNKKSVSNRKDKLSTDYMLLSGTSMSSPHIVGIAALIKAAHRDWSPAAIRSAMMTTADILDNTNGTILDMGTGVAATPLDYGAGHVNPNKAMDPGLIYDAGVSDYIKFLCGMNYTTKQIAVIARTSNFSCADASLDLNYPSFIAISNSTKAKTFTYKRVLTSVDESKSDYTATVLSPSGMKVVVQPSTISFQGKNTKAEFTLTVEIDAGSNLGTGAYGYLTWYEVNGKHVVRSPIVFATSGGNTTEYVPLPPRSSEKSHNY